MTARIYYEVQKDSPIQKFCEQQAEARTAKKLDFANYAESKGAKGWTEGWGSVNGLVFDEGAEIPVGFRAERRKTTDGRTRYVAAIRKPEGKAIAAEMEALGYLPNDDKFCEEFGVPRSMSYNDPDGKLRGSMRFVSCGFMNTCGIAWAKLGDFWIILPDIAAEIEDVKSKGYVPDTPDFVLPAGLVKSSEARWDLAVAQAKVEEENAGS